MQSNVLSMLKHTHNVLDHIHFFNHNLVISLQTYTSFVRPMNYWYLQIFSWLPWWIGYLFEFHFFYLCRILTEMRNETSNLIHWTGKFSTAVHFTTCPILAELQKGDTQQPWPKTEHKLRVHVFRDATQNLCIIFGWRFFKLNKTMMDSGTKSRFGGWNDNMRLWKTHFIIQVLKL